MRRTILLIMVGVLLGSALPALAVTAWSAQARVATAGVKDAYAASSVGGTAAAAGLTVNRVDGVRVQVRTTDGLAAEVDVYGSVECADGTTKEAERTLITQADKAWTTVTLFKPADKRRGQCFIVTGASDWYGKKGSPLEVRILTTTY
jgi:hypothetical protein